MVQENIASFGGNPDNVTISGFSAGGMSVGTLLAMPAARGKFHKAMNRSGAANIVGTMDNAVKASRQYLNVLGVKEHDIDGLRKLTTQELLDGQQKLNMRSRESGGSFILPAVVDGNILPDYPMKLIKKGSAKNIPIMAGNMLDELKSMSSMDRRWVNWMKPVLPKD